MSHWRNAWTTPSWPTHSTGAISKVQVSGNNNLVDDAASCRRAHHRRQRQHRGRRSQARRHRATTAGRPRPWPCSPAAQPSTRAPTRWFPRESPPTSGVLCASRAAAVDIGAFESGPSVITVTTLADSGGSGATLREAIDYVNNDRPAGRRHDHLRRRPAGHDRAHPGHASRDRGQHGDHRPRRQSADDRRERNSSILSIQGGATVILSGLTLAGGSTLANPVGAPPPAAPSPTGAIC